MTGKHKISIRINSDYAFVAFVWLTTLFGCVAGQVVFTSVPLWLRLCAYAVLVLTSVIASLSILDVVQFVDAKR